MNTSTLTLCELSALPQSDFVELLEGIFEHSPWIAERAWALRPFHSVDELHAGMLSVLAAASTSEQLSLIQAHPELAGKEAEAGALTAASTQEQRGAGLDQCSAAELGRLRELNALYRHRHGFPFVIAVKGLSRKQILEAMTTRLARDSADEFHGGLEEIGKIARFRLNALLA
ncbi:2-oxo-4-hydroxy-4-carboxy-5-ureidoimidazoline decarboxylase [uncultured Aquitalea sp.]|uniref:2-oxo-4-hydroxy-4-carboxy-5-ureidoimidazoline decarboxylase n=1 Tax=uncultured Aquitalea sp. TaxID=540272 RepID=UPI0025DC7F77|nr:2-oxo-4-hydroxy-4-carboxy-5-ureidoimidazoline decarboxylase [uncultured Aquitalea sp.]